MFTLWLGLVPKWIVLEKIHIWFKADIFSILNMFGVLSRPTGLTCTYSHYMKQLNLTGYQCNYGFVNSWMTAIAVNRVISPCTLCRLRSYVNTLAISAGARYKCHVDTRPRCSHKQSWVGQAGRPWRKPVQWLPTSSGKATAWTGPLCMHATLADNQLLWASKTWCRVKVQPQCANWAQEISCLLRLAAAFYWRHVGLTDSVELCWCKPLRQDLPTLQCVLCLRSKKPTTHHRELPQGLSTIIKNQPRHNQGGHQTPKFPGLEAPQLLCHSSPSPPGPTEPSEIGPGGALMELPIRPIGAATS